MTKLREWLRSFFGKSKPSITPQPFELAGPGNAEIVGFNLRMTPIDFQKDGRPMDARLYDALQSYAKRQCGAPINFQLFSRLWVAEVFKPENDQSEIVGVAGIRMSPEIPLFHAGTFTAKDEVDLSILEKAQQMMFDRLQWYFADCGYRGQAIVVSVDPKEQRLCRWLLGRPNVHPENRYQIVIP